MYQILSLLLINYLIRFQKNKNNFFFLSINLLTYNEHQSTNEFLDSLASNYIMPYILQTTRLSSHAKTLIDNIFLNVLLCEAISENITATIYDHLPQFLCAPNVLSNPLCNKSNILRKDDQNLAKEILFLITLIKIGLKFSKLISRM